MIFWLLVLVLMGAAMASGYFLGAVRSMFSMIGMLVGALLSLPLTGLGGMILGLLKVEHPILVAFFGPLIPFLIISMAIFGIGFLAHHKVTMFFKYRTEDETYFRWERLSQRLGVCIGTLNGAVLVFLFAIAFYVPGYFSVQVESEETDPWYLGVINTVARDIDATGFSRTISPWIPASPAYFKAADTLGWLYHNPEATDRLSRYPLFLPLAREATYTNLANPDFKKFWRGRPSLVEFAQHALLRPFIQDHEYHTRMLTLLEGSLDDLNAYLQTGTSAQFADQLLVDRWRFNLGASWMHVTQRQLNLNVLEKKSLLFEYRQQWNDATLTAYLDKTLTIRKRAPGSREFRIDLDSGAGSQDARNAMEQLGQYLTEMVQFGFELAGVTGLSFAEMSKLQETDDIVIDRARYDARKADFDRLQPQFEKFGIEVIVGGSQVRLRNREAGGTFTDLKGSWEHQYANKHTVRFEDQRRTRTFDALVETNRLILMAERISLVFDR